MAEPNDEMVREYERPGRKHAGFTRGYDALMNRWNYVKDLREFERRRAARFVCEEHAS